MGDVRGTDRADVGRGRLGRRGQRQGRHRRDGEKPRLRPARNGMHGQGGILSANEIDKRLKAGADDKVMDQYQRRQKEMKIRIARECK